MDRWHLGEIRAAQHRTDLRRDGRGSGAQTGSQVLQNIASLLYTTDDLAAVQYQQVTVHLSGSKVNNGG